MAWTRNSNQMWEYTSSTINGNFNLHMEKSQPCAVGISVATGDATKYAPVHVFQSPALVVDADFEGLVFGKKIKVTLLEVNVDAPTNDPVITEAQ